MDYFVFKLNIEPSILIYEKRENRWEHFKKISIPNALLEIFFSDEQDGYIKIKCEMPDYSELKIELDNLKSKTLNLLKKYEVIRKNYLKSNEIHYNKAFLKLNNECGEIRRSIESKYPILKASHRMYSDNFIREKYNLILSSSVGTGIVHINKFYKDLYYYERHIENKDQLEKEITAYYEKNSELIYIKSDNETKAIDFCRYIETEINDSNKLGTVKINPVYERIEITEPVKYIQYTVTYPNGNTPDKIDSILKQSKASSKTTKYEGNDMDNWDPKPVMQDINEEGAKGYLEDVAIGKFKKLKQFIKKLKELPT